MAYFISHVAPLWSFAAPSNARRYGAVERAAARDWSRSPRPAVWRWVVGADGRPERRLASESPH
jgi:hypothetical protein